MANLLRHVTRTGSRALLALTALAMVACSSGAVSPGDLPGLPTATPDGAVTPVGPEVVPTDVPSAVNPTPAPLDPTAPASEAPVTTPVPDPTSPAPKPLRMASPEFGVQAFMWWRPEVASRDLQAARDAGFGWVKVGFGWRDIEGAGKGIFDWSRTDLIVGMANAEGIDLLVRVDHQPAWAGGGFPLSGPPANLADWGDFLTAMTSRYRGRVRAYQLWNEPNLAREWGDQIPDPGAYAQMLRVGYAAVKAGDPNAMVISAGLSPTGSWTDEARPDDWYLRSMYEAMGRDSTGYFDVLGVHGPGYKAAPETSPDEVEARPDLGGHRSFCFRRVEDLRAIMVEYGDAGKQVALLEFGWTSDPRPDSPYHWHAVSEEVKADYIVRAFQYAREHWSPWIGVMSLIYIADHDWTQADEQYWWAITDPGYPELQARIAYTAIKNMPK